MIPPSLHGYYIKLAKIQKEIAQNITKSWKFPSSDDQKLKK